MKVMVQLGWQWPCWIQLALARYLSTAKSGGSCCSVKPASRIALLFRNH